MGWLYPLEGVPESQSKLIYLKDEAMSSLLAVDLGLKTGLALYGDSGKLVWYRSHNFGTTERLRRAVPGIMDNIPNLTALVIEGGGNLATVWEKEAEKREIAVLWSAKGL